MGLMHVKCQVYACYPVSKELKKYAIGQVVETADTFEAEIPAEIFNELRNQKPQFYKEPIQVVEDAVEGEAVEVVEVPVVKATPKRKAKKE